MGFKSSTWNRKNCFSNTMQGFSACVDADYDIKEKHNGYSTNSAMNTLWTLFMATASRWNLSKFVVIKHFGWESLNVQPCCLDVVLYMLNCVFWRHIPLEIEYKSRVDMGSDSNRYTAQRYNPWAVAQLSTRKKNKKRKQGEFKTPPYLTGRRSN